MWVLMLSTFAYIHSAARRKSSRLPLLLRSVPTVQIPLVLFKRFIKSLLQLVGIKLLILDVHPRMTSNKVIQPIRLRVYGEPLVL